MACADGTGFASHLAGTLAGALSARVDRMITLTTSAVAAVKAALSRAADAEGLRVVAEAGTGAGAEAGMDVRYSMHLETTARDGDMVIEQGGLKVFIDRPSRAMTLGIRIDFVGAPGRGGFVFEDHPVSLAQRGAGLPN